MLTINGTKITTDATLASELAEDAVLRALTGGYVMERTPSGWVGTHPERNDISIHLVAA